MRTYQDLLLFKLAADEGYDEVDDMLETDTFDSIARGICTECEATTTCEPDATANYCESCGCRTVKSSLVLAGLA